MALVLIADDVAMARELLARQLRGEGHRVTLVNDGVEAVTRFEQEHPDVVVLDVHMPRLSGLEACTRIKSMPGYTPVILMSARADVSSRVAALAVADDFVAKPYEAEEMKARIGARLRVRRMIEELGRSGASPNLGEARIRNRTQFLERVAHEWQRCARFNEPLSLLLAGIEGGGDQAQNALGGILVRVLRQIDVVGRTEQNQFAVLLPNTHVSGALVAASRIKRQLGSLENLSAHASLGIACYPGRDINSADDLMSMAGRALERAREEGQGQICLYQHQGYLFRPKV